MLMDDEYPCIVGAIEDGATDRSRYRWRWHHHQAIGGAGLPVKLERTSSVTRQSLRFASLKKWGCSANQGRGQQGAGIGSLCSSWPSKRQHMQVYRQAQAPRIRAAG